MTDTVLYILSLIIPMIVLPIVLPMVVLMARRKRMTDNPSRRKLQERPVAVMGGTVVILSLSVSLLIINIFYDISTLFPLLCMMVIFYIFGMLDDNIGLTWKFKLILQVVAILLLFVGSNYGVHSLYSLFNNTEFHWSIALVLTLYSGVLLLNAVNFVDGIDGLATGLASIVAVAMGYWNYLHGFTTQAVFAAAMLGILVTFFVFNVFSERYKTYMGDSGSLVLGLFVFAFACPDVYGVMNPNFLMDHYFVSFIIALLSAMIYDLIRVALWRMVNHQSPFRPDRSHLHHAYVDLGMSHFMATSTIVLTNYLALLFWYLTARMDLSQWLQLSLVLVFCALLYWVPYFYLCYIRDHHSRRYYRLSYRVRFINRGFDKVHHLLCRFVDGYHSHISHEIE